MKKIKIILSFIVLGIIMTSCNNNDETASNYPYAVKMTDAPGPYQAVNVDLIGVEVTGNGGETVMLNVKKGIYNLLDLTNGKSTLIATDTLQISKVEQIRLILGTNNTVVVDNTTYPLSTPSAEQSGLKLQVHQTLEQGIMYNVLLDFDANKSIVNTGNGAYKLKPVVRTIETAISGNIKGKITPVGSLAVVTAVDAVTNLSYSTSVSATGEFLLMGLPSGTYTVTVTPVFPLLPVIKSTIVVTVGNTTDLGTTAF
jgi:hypothetical protein